MQSIDSNFYISDKGTITLPTYTALPYWVPIQELPYSMHSSSMKNGLGAKDKHDYDAKRFI